MGPFAQVVQNKGVAAELAYGLAVEADRFAGIGPVNLRHSAKARDDDPFETVDVGWRGKFRRSAGRDFKSNGSRASRARQAEGVLARAEFAQLLVETTVFELTDPIAVESHLS